MPFAALLLALAPAPAPAIDGLWKTPDGKALVRIGPCGEQYCGHVERLLVKPPPGKSHDVNNPDPNLRTRPILGLTILWGFSRDDDEWRGTIYDPQHGKTYRSILEPADDGSLKVKGCISIFCKTQIWQRAG